MLAFSAVTQFPTNGFSSREAGAVVQASSSAEHIMTEQIRGIDIASPEPGTTTQAFLDRLVFISRQAHVR